MLMKSPSSALLQRLNFHGPMTENALDTLIALEAKPVKLKKRAKIFGKGEDAHVAILHSGWAAGRYTDGHGRTAITQIFLPGDIIGLSELAVDEPVQDYVMQTDGAVCLFDRRTYLTLVHRSPELFQRIAVAESLRQAAQLDRLYAIAKRPAEDRLIDFILNIRARMNQVHEQDSDRFPIHLSQKEIGDLLGLTDIYVNRLIRKMQKDGALEISRPYFRINTPGEWEDKIGFVDRFRKKALPAA